MRYALALAAAALALAGCSSTGPAVPGVGGGSSAEVLDAQTVTTRLVGLVPSVKPDVVYTAADDPNKLLGRPNGYASKTAFVDTRVDAKPLDDVGARSDAIERGGSVEVYEDPAAAEARMKYIQELGRGVPAFGEYDYVSGGVLVRVSRELTPDQAADYEKALVRVVSG